MARWEPDGRSRLEQAAYALFDERGYEATTVADIAERAGLTKRTFFRHYADKREVLFGGSGTLAEMLVTALAQIPADLAPLDTVVTAVAALGSYFDDGHLDFARRRYRMVTEHPDLQERELIKMASLTATVAAALRERGTDEPAATLAAEAGITVFKHAFERWVTDGGDFGALAHRSADDLRAVTLRG